LNELAKNAENNGGVYFVPAFSGLGSPWWLSDAKAMITGLTLSTKREHIVRAAFESVAYQVADVVELVSRNLDSPLNVLCVDGDAARNDFLIQFQADMLGFPVRRLSLEEASGLGSAILNCCALGVFTTIEQVKNIRTNRQVFNPVMKPEERNVYHQGWLHSVHTLILGTKR
jgi:glycerol kinase